MSQWIEGGKGQDDCTTCKGEGQIPNPDARPLWVDLADPQGAQPTKLQCKVCGGHGWMTPEAKHREDCFVVLTFAEALLQSVWIQGALCQYPQSLGVQKSQALFDPRTEWFDITGALTRVIRARLVYQRKMYTDLTPQEVWETPLYLEVTHALVAVLWGNQDLLTWKEMSQGRWHLWSDHARLQKWNDFERRTQSEVVQLLQTVRTQYEFPV